jgi:hypothetical protein
MIIITKSRTHNIVHIALGGRKEIGILKLLINNQKVWQSVQERPNATCTEPLQHILKNGHVCK